MLNIKIIAVGRVKEKSYSDLISKYEKRLKPYAKFEIIELQSEPFKKEQDKDKVKKNEEEKFLKIMERNNKSLIIALDERGKEFTSQKFAEFLKAEKGEIIFLIAGALGFTEKIKNSANINISLSQLTFPHEMARMIVMEQIYRAITILKNKKYHY